MSIHGQTHGVHISLERTTLMERQRCGSLVTWADGRVGLSSARETISTTERLRIGIDTDCTVDHRLKRVV